jgi:predicted small lipoprotein YifL
MTEFVLMAFAHHRSVTGIVAMLSLCLGLVGCGLKGPLYLGPPYPPKKPPVDRSWTPPPYVAVPPPADDDQEPWDDDDPLGPLFMEGLALSPPPLVVE